MTHEEFYTSVFLASLPIAAQITTSKKGSDIVKEAHNMAKEASTYWQEQMQLKEYHQYSQERHG
jgi:hypothetical protein